MPLYFSFWRFYALANASVGVFFCSCRLCQYAGAAGELWISEIERLETLAEIFRDTHLIAD